MRFSVFVILLSVFFLALSPSARAAEISFEAPSREWGVGGEFAMTLFLNTEKEEINALEGAITFPQELLELKEIRDGGSIINFWLERPQAERGGKIVFSGITPGGYKSSKGSIFSIIFRAKTSGEGIINFESMRILKNDGQGTPARVRISPLHFAISEKLKQSPPEAIKDTEPPESFVPELAHDSAFFDEKWFLVFTTQDKKSGIDHYEVKETRQRIFTPLLPEWRILKSFPWEKLHALWRGVTGFTFNSPWISAESPYELKDQELRSYVLVKAVDRAGNARVVSVEPKNPLAWYENYENWIIILSAIIVLSAIKYIAWGKSKKS